MNLYAIVDRPTAEPHLRHHRGLPPELATGETGRETLPWPRALIVEDNPGGGVLMKRYASDSTFAGDTWHASPEEAKEQAQFEYDAAVGEWKELPPDVADPVSYVLSQNQ